VKSIIILKEVRPIAKIYLLRSENEWIANYFYVEKTRLRKKLERGGCKQ